MKLVPCLGLLDLQSCLAEVTECVNWQECERGVVKQTVIEVEGYSADVPLEGVTDVLWFRENLLCIASNAVKHSRHNETVIRVQLIRKTDSDRMRSIRNNRCCPVIEISVQDSGHPLSNVSLSCFFSRPTQSKRDDVGGMGLGLICLAERVSTLGGTFGAHRRLDGCEGNIVWFRIPFPPVKFNQATRLSRGSMTLMVEKSPEDEEARTRSVEALSNLSILVVDDAVPILKIMNFVLTKAKAVVTQAKNGKEAVDLAICRWFDIIITDIQMPIMDGFEACKLIRENEGLIGGRRSIIIGISADSRYLNCEDAATAGMDGFLAKPFQLKDLARDYQRVREERLLTREEIPGRRPTIRMKSMDGEDTTVSVVSLAPDGLDAV